MSSSLKLDFFIWLFLQVAWPCGRACYTRFSRAFKWLGFWGDGQAVSHEFAKSLHTNTNVKCVLGVNDPDTADFFAKHFGTYTTEKKTERATKQGRFSDPERTGEMSIREVEEYKIHPNKLRNFSEGRGVLSLIHHGQAITEEIQFARSPI